MLTGIPLIAFLIYAFYRLTRKEKAPAPPKPGKVSVILINSLTGEVEPKTITADWNEYARQIGADTITIGARGRGWVVFVNERLNSALNMEVAGGFSIMRANPTYFKGSGLVVPTGAETEGVQVEIFVLGNPVSQIHSIGI